MENSCCAKCGKMFKEGESFIENDTPDGLLRYCTACESSLSSDPRWKKWMTQMKSNANVVHFIDGAFMGAGVSLAGIVAACILFTLCGSVAMMFYYLFHFLGQSIGNAVVVCGIMIVASSLACGVYNVIEKK